MKEDFRHQYGKILVEPGYQAPDFTLKDENGRNVSLFEFKDGHLTVLLFIKGTDDRHTREQLDYLKDSYDRIKFHNADVLVVSTGDEVFNRRLVHDMRLPFHILSDSSCKVLKLYDIYNKFDTLVGPMLFIINSAGLINFFYDGKNPEDIVDTADVIRMLHELGGNDALIFGGVAERNL
jgi:thioredoxin-dependent peroxiredoxin